MKWQKLRKKKILKVVQLKYLCFYILLQGSRDENQMADMHKVKEDAQRLYQAGNFKIYFITVRR